MILDVIKTDTVFKVEVKNLNQTRVEVGLGFLKYDNGYSVFTNNKLFKIEIIDKSKLDEIDFFFQVKSYTAVINITESIRDSFFTMEIMFFAYPLREMYKPFYISLDEKILETAKKRKFIKGKDNVDKLAEVLKEKISFKINDESYFLVSTASSSENEIFEEELFKIGDNIKKIEKSKNLSDEDKETYIEENHENLQKIESQKKGLAFSIHGENIHLPVKKDITKSGDYRFTATKLVSFRNSIKKDSLQLIKADIEFKNGLVSERIAKDLGNIVESDESYLKKWDEYSKLEGEMLLAKAQQIGELKLVGSPNKIADGLLTTSSAKVNHFGLPIGVSKADKHKLPFRNSPVRAIGETEGRLYASYGGRKFLAELVDRGASTETHAALYRNILEAMKPSDMDVGVDRTKVPYGKHKALEILEVLFNSVGVDITFTQDRRRYVEPPKTINDENIDIDNVDITEDDDIDTDD